MTVKANNNIMLPEFRVSYPNVFKPVNTATEGEPPKMEYTMEVLFAKDTDLSGLKKAIDEAIVKTWGPDKTKWPANLRKPLKDQGTKAKQSPHLVSGAAYFQMKSRQKPGLVDQKLNDIIDPSEFYGGCYARATVQVAAYNKPMSKGVSIWMQNIQKIRDGEAFSGRTKAQEDFEPIAAAGEPDSVGGGLFD